MLRWLLGALLLLNAGLLAAHLGAFGALGEREREPQRSSRQVSPELLKLLPPSAVERGERAPAAPAGLPPAGAAPTTTGGAATANGTTAEAAASLPVAAVGALTAASGAAAAALSGATILAAVPTACLQLQPLHPSQSAAVQASLRQAGLSDDAWREQPLPATPVHHVLMGPYADRALLARKERELRRRKLDWVELQPAPNLPAGLAPGLSLGTYASAAAARAALANFAARGVRSAQVVSPPPLEGLLRLTLASLGPSQWPGVLRMPPPANTRWTPCAGTRLPALPEAAASGAGLAVASGASGSAQAPGR